MSSLEIVFGNNCIFPRLSAISCSVLSNGSTIVFRSFFLVLDILVFHEFVGLCLYHIDVGGGFYDKIWFILVCSIRPIYSKLVWYRTNPFYYIGIVF